MVVTGAGRGLGAAHARLFARLGATVVHDAGVRLDGTGGARAPAESVVEEITRSGGLAVPCFEDLTEIDASDRIIDLALERTGRVDVLVSNAGVLAWIDIEETDDEVWRRMLAVGVEAPYRLCRAAFRAMKRQHFGRIVLAVSGRAMYVDASMVGLSAYSLGKGAQLGLMVALAAEGEPFDIRVNALSPVAATRMHHREVRSGELNPEGVSPGAAFLASSACEVSGVAPRGRWQVLRSSMVVQRGRGLRRSASFGR